MNEGRLRQLAWHILEEPLRLDMDFIMYQGSPGSPNVYLSFNTGVSGQTFPACGAVGCLAGWAATLADLRPGWDEGRLVLDLTAREAHRLFTEPRHMLTFTRNDGWPTEFAGRYLASKDPAVRAQVTAERILHFIDTGGRE